MAGSSRPITPVGRALPRERHRASLRTGRRLRSRGPLSGGKKPVDLRCTLTETLRSIWSSRFAAPTYARP